MGLLVLCGNDSHVLPGGKVRGQCPKQICVSHADGGYGPKLKEALDIVQQYGGDSMAALRGEAEKMGIDPDEIMNMLK